MIIYIAMVEAQIMPGICLYDRMLLELQAAIIILYRVLSTIMARSLQMVRPGLILSTM